MHEQQRLVAHAPQRRSTATIAGLDMQYRYDLTREWGSRNWQLWVMLNPSTADAHADDATIRRCMSFARREQHDGIVVVNLYAYRATDPRELLDVRDPIGPGNVRTIHRWLDDKRVADVVLAWGAHVDWLARSIDSLHDQVPSWVAERGLTPKCLGVTSSGQPRHPVRLPGYTELIDYRWGT